MRILCCLIIMLSLSCSNDNPHPENDCEPIIIDAMTFGQNPFAQVDLVDFSLMGACLKVSLGVGGCDDDHKIEMITDGAIAESDPPQITFDFKDTAPQPCNAYFIIDREFDLSSIYDLYEGDIIINFRQSDTSISFEQ